MHDRGRMHVFVLIDALGWSILEHCEFLGHILPVRFPIRTVLGFSSGAIPTILTGLPPSQNGHWNLLYYDPRSSPFHWLRYLSFLPDRVLDNRLSRKLLKEVGRRFLGLGPLFECCVSPRLLHCFNWAETRNIYDKAGIRGAPSIFDRLSSAGVPYRVYSYHTATDGEILRQAQYDIGAGEASFYFLYLSEMDQVLHNHRGDFQTIAEKLSWYADSLECIFRAALKVDEDTTFTIFSDHGMTPVRHFADLKREVESVGFAMPRDYLAVYDSTMARFWFFEPQTRKEITERLSALSYGRILSEDELRELGVFFADHRYGEVVFLLHPGWLISKSQFNGNAWMPTGMHGYHPSDADSDGVFLSNRQPPVCVASIADLYGCMRQATMADSEPSGLCTGAATANER